MSDDVGLAWFQDTFREDAAAPPPVPPSPPDGAAEPVPPTAPAETTSDAACLASPPVPPTARAEGDVAPPIPPPSSTVKARSSQMKRVLVPGAALNELAGGSENSAAFDFERTHNFGLSTPYRLQGDMAWHENQELVAKRHALRSHPDVVRAIEKFWDVIRKVDAAGEGNVLCVAQDDMVEMLCCCQRALTPADEFDAEDARQSATEDWLRDMCVVTERGDDVSGAATVVVAGVPHMSQHGFFSSLFEAADMWTDDAEVESYVDFLTRLFDRITTTITRPDGSTAAEDEDVSTEVKASSGAAPDDTPDGTTGQEAGRSKETDKPAGSAAEPPSESAPPAEKKGGAALRFLSVADVRPLAMVQARASVPSVGGNGNGRGKSEAEGEKKRHSENSTASAAVSAAVSAAASAAQERLDKVMAGMEELDGRVRRGNSGAVDHDFEARLTALEAKQQQQQLLVATQKVDTAGSSSESAAPVAPQTPPMPPGKSRETPAVSAATPAPTTEALPPAITVGMRVRHRAKGTLHVVKTYAPSPNRAVKTIRVTGRGATYSPARFFDFFESATDAAAAPSVPGKKHVGSRSGSRSTSRSSSTSSSTSSSSTSTSSRNSAGSRRGQSRRSSSKGHGRSVAKKTLRLGFGGGDGDDGVLPPTPPRPQQHQYHSHQQPHPQEPRPGVVRPTPPSSAIAVTMRTPPSRMHMGQRGERGVGADRSSLRSGEGRLRQAVDMDLTVHSATLNRGRSHKGEGIVPASATGPGGAAGATVHNRSWSQSLQESEYVDQS